MAAGDLSHIWNLGVPCLAPGFSNVAGAWNSDSHRICLEPSDRLLISIQLAEPSINRARVNPMTGSACMVRLKKRI